MCNKQVLYGCLPVLYYPKENTYQSDNIYLNSHLENVSKWLIDDRLKLNVNKTRYMLFYSGKTEVWKNTNLDKK